ncbi:MAG: alpha/beta fold hydrolase [Paludisphaera borealis]|uniref:alpha/beta fold hydrolase n=1 Tax=Paludisphaera borealis TaxID=1387353 RepID=UPI00284E2660|nr:alpha/beta fold hydrolase [Paludisphaera borealis]MDR3618129.1 alpha/beta fold hydrolase [Paludisphaera borealis]
MTELPHDDVRFRASDGYELQIAVWPAVGEVKGQVVVLHGVQSHSGWYHQLGETLARAGYTASFPNRRGSGPNQQDRGHAPSGGRLVNDVAEWIDRLKTESPALPVALAGISWGGKVAVLTSVRRPELVDALALVCPGLEPQVGVSLAVKLRIAGAAIFNRRKTFPIPLADPALFTDNVEKQEFIRNDPLSLREGTAGLMAASFFIDRMIKRAPRRLHQPALLMLAGRDRIVDNARTLAYFERLASTDRRVIDYPDGCHTLEFDPDPTRYARDLIAWLDERLKLKRNT